MKRTISTARSLYQPRIRRWPVQCRLFSASLHSSDDSKNEKPEWTAKAIEIAPGLAAAALVATCSFAAADGIGTLLLASPPGQSPISGIPVSIILGMGISNTLGLPAQLKPGLSFCSTTMLRTGITAQPSARCNNKALRAITTNFSPRLTHHHHRRRRRRHDRHRLRRG